jgi:hypothetical protein
VRDLEVLIGELLSIDGLAPGAISAREVSSLDHEVGDHAVEGGALVVQRLPSRRCRARLAGAECAEVLAGAGGDVAVELHHDAARGLVPDGNVEEDLARDETRSMAKEKEEEKEGKENIRNGRNIVI